MHRWPKEVFIEIASKLLLRDIVGANFTILQIPAYKTGHALFQRCCRNETDGCAEVIHISIGGRHITRLHRQQVALGLFANRPFQAFDVLQEFDRLVISNVVYPKRR